MPKKINYTGEIQENDEIDVQIELKKSYNPNQDKKVWVRGRVVKITENHLNVVTCDDNFPLTINKNSFEYAQKGKMTLDYEWRTTLNPGDMVDGYDRGKWHPSTILTAKTEVVNGFPKVEYKVGFRVYPKYCENWQDYKKIWPEKNLAKDNNGDEYLGDAENMDETMPYFIKRIQKYLMLKKIRHNAWSRNTFRIRHLPTRRLYHCI